MPRVVPREVEREARQPGPGCGEERGHLALRHRDHGLLGRDPLAEPAGAGCCSCGGAGSARAGPTAARLRRTAGGGSRPGTLTTTSRASTTSPSWSSTAGHLRFSTRTRRTVAGWRILPPRRLDRVGHRLPELDPAAERIEGVARGALFRVVELPHVEVLRRRVLPRLRGDLLEHRDRLPDEVDALVGGVLRIHSRSEA